MSKPSSVAQEHKKRKDILIVLIVLLFLGTLVLSFVNFLMESSQYSLNDVKEQQSSELIGEVDADTYKETWAQSVDLKNKKLNKDIENITVSINLEREARKADQEKFKLLMEELLKNNNTLKKDIENREADFEKNKAKLTSELKMEFKSEIEKAKTKSLKLEKDIEALQNQKPIIINKYESTTKKGEPSLPPLVKKKATNSEIKKINKKITNLPDTKGKPDIVPKEVDTTFFKDIDKLPTVEKKVKVVADTKKIIEVKKDINPNAFYFEEYSFENVGNDVNYSDYLKQNSENDVKDEEENYLGKFETALGFSNGYLILGINAPILENADTETAIPVLIEARGDIKIANDNIISMDKCFLIGSAVGDAPSSTAKIRLSEMECILQEGKKKVRGKIKGWVIGKTGQPGTPGELIHRSGEYLAKMLKAGLFGGISQTILQIATNSTVNNTGATTANPVNVLTSNTASSTSNTLDQAFNKYIDYFQQLAEQTFPIIEVKGGQRVSLLFQGGEIFEVTDFKGFNVNDIEEYLYENEE
jgi:hypothetical protein